MRVRLKIIWNLNDAGKYTLTRWAKMIENDIEELELLIRNVIKSEGLLSVVFENGNKAIISSYVLRNCIIEIITEDDTQEKD